MLLICYDFLSEKDTLLENTQFLRYSFGGYWFND